MNFVSYFVITVTIAFLMMFVLPQKKTRDYYILTILLILNTVAGSALAFNQLGII